MKNCFYIVFLPAVITAELFAQVLSLADIRVQETAGLGRTEEYVEFQVQFASGAPDPDKQLIVYDKKSGTKTGCQVLEKSLTPDGSLQILRLVFPVTISGGEYHDYTLVQTNESLITNTDMNLTGSGFDRIIENSYYRADLSKNEKIEPQSYDSGQIREIFVKMGFGQMLTNAEDRIHWAPNFKRPEIEWYTTIAHWQEPAFYQVNSGPFVIETKRRGAAPQHPEIDLTAVYKFYAHKPWFRFFSRMEMVQDVWLELLRNDEMTMDSMFTHLAFERADGRLEDVAFGERFDLLKEEPIANEAKWICFYNAGSGMAYGSIRIKYDITNQFGEPSPVYEPHTRIGEWLGGIKYWNRRLIHDHLTMVPQGSRYSEENIYLIFRIGDQDKFAPIRALTGQMNNPLVVKVEYVVGEN